MRQNCLSRNAWLRDGARCAGLAMAGLLLAMAAVLVGTGWLDVAFTTGAASHRRRSFVPLPLALLGRVCGRCDPRLFPRGNRWGRAGEAKGGLRYAARAVAVARAFALFPLLGFAIPLAVIAGIVVAVPLAAIRQLERQDAAGRPDSLSTRPDDRAAVGDDAALHPAQDGKRRRHRDSGVVAARRPLAWLPFVLLLVVVWAGAELKRRASGSILTGFPVFRPLAGRLPDRRRLVAPTLAEQVRSRARRSGRHPFVSAEARVATW